MCVVCRKLKVAKLAWVSAQIHCQCSVSENRVVLPVDSTQVAVSSSDTSFVPFKGLPFLPLCDSFIALHSSTCCTSEQYC